MKIYSSFEDVKRDPDTVLTVGTFDGVHLGHQKIIKRLLEVAEEENSRHLIMTFHPHPQTILRKEDRKRLFLLTSVTERIKLFRKFGIENVFVIPFSYEFSQTPPEVFVRRYLHDTIGLKKILIGYDHLFGKNREGNENLLKNLSDELNFKIEKVEPYDQEGTIISSTKIRKALQMKDLDLANKMLGYNYFVDGIVVRGDGRGKKLGFPTANVYILDINKLMPGNGVYLVEATINNGKVFGMANLGTRPTFTEDILPTLEIYFFDFDKDIYDKNLSVKFLKFIREERKFSGKDEFLEQLEKDNRYCLDLLKDYA